jgi:hypothetical protein
MTFLSVLLIPVAFYLAYVVKRRLGIDIFPHWGLHLPGPRSLARRFRAIFRERAS